MTSKTPLTTCLSLLALLLACCPALQAAPDGKPPIVVAAIFALSGPAAASNSPGVAGTQLAVAELNSKGGILDRPLSLVVFDNQSTPIGSRLAAEEAARQGVVAIIGAQWSSHSLAIAPVAQRHHIPMISPISTVTRLTSYGDTIFRVCFSNDFQGRALANFADKDLHAKRATIFINLHSDFSMEIAKVFKEQFQANGGTIVREVEYKPAQIDYEKLINLARAEPADILFLSGHDESGSIALELQKAQLPGTLLGTDGWDAPSFFKSGGNQLQQAFFSTHWFKDSPAPLSQAFIERQVKGKPEPTAPTALAYDAVNILAAAIHQAGSDQRQAIRASLASTSDFPGITGSISFDANGNAQKAAVIIEIHNGQTRLCKAINPQ